MDKLIAFAGALIIICFTFSPFIVWFLLMRPYIKKKGVAPAMGIDWLYSQFVDVEKLFTICKKNKEHLPWFFWLWLLPNLLFLALFLFIFVLLIILSITQS
jgi:hypothetical protein